MRAAEQLQRFNKTTLPRWFRPQRQLSNGLAAAAANDALSALERGATRLQRAARAAADALQRSPGLRRSAGAGAGLGALRLVRAHPALTAGIALGAVGVAVLIWRRRQAHAQAMRPQPISEYEPEYL